MFVFRHRLIGRAPYALTIEPHEHCAQEVQCLPHQNRSPVETDPPATYDSKVTGVIHTRPRSKTEPPLTHTYREQAQCTEGAFVHAPQGSPRSCLPFDKQPRPAPLFSQVHTSGQTTTVPSGHEDPGDIRNPGEIGVSYGHNSIYIADRSVPMSCQKVKSMGRFVQSQ